jgi:hypothetical protein
MLLSMAESYGKYEGFILARLMDLWPPSKRYAKSDARNEAFEARANDALSFNIDRERETIYISK